MSSSVNSTPAILAKPASVFSCASHSGRFASAKASGAWYRNSHSLASDFNFRKLSRSNDLKDHRRLVSRPVESSRTQQGDAII